MTAWAVGALGVLPLPSGRLVRGRGLGRPLFDGRLPEFGVYLLNNRPEPVSWLCCVGRSGGMVERWGGESDGEHQLIERLQ